MKVDPGDVLAGDFDLPDVAASQTAFMGEADEFDGQRVETHHLRGHGIDCDHVAAGQDVVLDYGDHTTRTGPVAGKSPVHDGEDTGMNLLVDGQEVDQRFVDDAMRPVALWVVEQAG